MSRIALATCSALPGLDDDSRLLLDALNGRAVAVVWDDPAVDWASFDACLIRSTWDYHRRREEFLAWARRVASVTRLWNPLSVVEWNTDKAYLRRFPSIPTTWLSRGSRAELVLEDAVIKPRVSASGENTWRVRPGKPGQALLDALLVEHDVMVQPYISSVETEGEISLTYLAGEFSHAIRKVPRPGEFRSQEEWGSEIRAITPGAEERRFSDEVLAAVEEPLLYARVDLVRGDRLLLAELELVEPSLYFRFSPVSAEKFAAAIQRGL